MGDVAHIGCPPRPGYDKIDVVFLVGCVKSPYHAESSKQRPHRQVWAWHAHCHSSRRPSQHPQGSQHCPRLRVASACSAMWADEWSDWQWPAQQAAAAPSTPPQAPAWWSVHWVTAQSWPTTPWWEDVMAQGKDKGTHADKGKGKGWGIPPGSGTSHTGCDKGHQGNSADQGKPVEGTGGCTSLPCRQGQTC